ncbi:MAG: hypothetical protein H7835_09185 [Magnetococcus sp. XQGC-1]
MSRTRPKTRSPFLILLLLTCREGIRQRLLLVLLGVMGVGLFLAGFAGSLAVTEAGELRSAFLGAFLRLSAALLTALYVLHSQFREHQDKGLEWLLALPISKTVYYFGKISGYALLIGLMVLFFGTLLLFFAPAGQVALWGVSLLLELGLVAAFSFLVQLSLRSLPAAFLVVLLFYLLSRSMASLQLVGQGVIMPQGGIFWSFSRSVLDGVAYLLPALERFTRSEWLAYASGGWEDLLFVALQGGSYLLLLAGASLIDLYRKNV